MVTSGVVVSAIHEYDAGVHTVHLMVSDVLLCVPVLTVTLRQLAVFTQCWSAKQGLGSLVPESSKRRQAGAHFKGQLGIPGKGENVQAL